jgi:hypothetical protein
MFDGSIDRSSVEHEIIYARIWDNLKSVPTTVFVSLEHIKVPDAMSVVEGVANAFVKVSIYLFAFASQCR